MQGPTLAEIRNARQDLEGLVVETPVWRWRSDALDAAVGAGTQVLIKLELFQHGGSFKPRGALCNLRALSREQLSRGVTAVSAGNHAMAVGYAARALGTTAKVVMPKNANPARVQGSRDYGAEVELVDDVHRAFDRVKEIEEKEGRAFIHPFEGPLTALGTATLGLELCAQAQDLDAVVIPIGGGGLCGGVAAAVKQISPRTLVFGVEPEGADTMHRSFASGKPEGIDKVRTIADSLGAPHAAPYSFGLCRTYVDDLAKVSDDQIRAAMLLLFRSAKLAVEPAGAAATAALCGPLRERLQGKRVALIVCGANIDRETFCGHLAAAERAG
ncbi:MAG: threonine/serine dehydratase [Deltaproteobacteria bacterium]|nr:MAG: threonine/serine dehydratase [Deltaproteobacteria bacterium]